jgi:acetyl esterase/lipase
MMQVKRVRRAVVVVALLMVATSGVVAGGSAPVGAATSAPECAGLPAANPPTIGAALMAVWDPAEPIVRRYQAYLPAGGALARPAVVMVHGGDFNAGNGGIVATDSDACMAAALAANGFAVFWVDYSLVSTAFQIVCPVDTTAGSPVVTTPGVGGCFFGDPGRPTTGWTLALPAAVDPIPLGATIVSVADSTHATLSANATSTATGVNVVAFALPPPPDANSFPAAVDDLRAFVEWLREPEQVAQFGIDPTRIGALGFSAGGGLVDSLAVGGSGALDQGSRIRAAASWSGPTNFTDTSLLPSPPTVQDISLAVIASMYVGCSTFPGPDQAGCLAGRAREASPLFAVDPSDPPMLLATGNPDGVVPQSQTTQLAQALTAAGVPNDVVLGPAFCHAEGCDTAAWVPTLRFFLTTLGVAPAPVPEPIVLPPAFTG